jgi:hypothetical protein
VTQGVPAGVVAEEDIGADALARLLAVALGQVGLPGFGITLVER